MAGANFGCGSSRQHAVRGLQQAGIRAVIAPSFGEKLLLECEEQRLAAGLLTERDVATSMDDADDLDGGRMEVNVDSMRVRSRRLDATFPLAPRHRCMLLEGLDVIGLTLKYQAQIDAFKARHWLAHPWMRNVADTTR